MKNFPDLQSFTMWYKKEKSYLCKQTKNVTHSIFKIELFIVNFNIRYKLHGYPGIFTRVGEQVYGKYTAFSTILQSVKINNVNKKKQNKKRYKNIWNFFIHNPLFDRLKIKPFVECLLFLWRLELILFDTIRIKGKKLFRNYYKPFTR